MYDKLSKRTTIYYAHPYCSWERGSNKNNNKLIRKFIKKKTDIKNFSVAYIKKYKTGLIIILENYLIINRLRIFFTRT